ISLGLPDGLLGVGWPSMSAEFGVPLSAVGFVITVGTAGYVASSVAAGFTIARLGVGWLLAGSTALVSVALVGYAAAPALVLVVGFALLLGLGSGAIDSGLNAYAAGNFGARHMNWLHASFGLGATIGPLVMTGVLDAGLAWRWGYGVVAAAQALLAAAFLVTARSWAAHRAGRAEEEAAAATDPAVRVRDTLRLPGVWFGAGAFAVYVGLEIGAGLWAYTLLTDGRGLPAGVAGVCVSAYWGSLFVGRLALGAFGDRISTRRVLLASLGGIAAGAVLVALPAPAWVAVGGLMLIGLSAAPVFPLMTLTTAERVGLAHADRAIGVQMGTCALGGALIPAGLGVMITRYGTDVLGPALALLSVLLLVLYLAASRRRPAVT
ncbi:MAG TPA: MFS transporter, partial [Micromonosporaceae bacterium]|nr:MFS transporter [Micromonosporaceae bacterium]